MAEQEVRQTAASNQEPGDWKTVAGVTLPGGRRLELQRNGEPDKNSGGGIGEALSHAGDLMRTARDRAGLLINNLRSAGDEGASVAPAVSENSTRRE